MNHQELMRKLFPSQEMADYLAGQELDPEDLLEAIAGAPIPLREKSGILQDLAQESNEPFAFWAREVNTALRALDTKPGEFFYLKSGWPDYEEGWADIDPIAPYPDLERAMRGIQQFLEEEECIEEDCYWFLLEKWVLNEMGNYVCPYVYTVAKGEVHYFEKKDKKAPRIDIFSSSTFFESTHLNLPIPFRPGDIVQLDCTPFAFRANAVILEVGDNKDCCCVQVIFRIEDGTWSAGALKHGHGFSQHYTPMLSPLYRLSTVRQELAQEEKILEEVSKFVAGSDKKGYALWAQIAFEHISEAKIRDFIQRETLK